jgi:5-methylcytosine-specific restriction endonuclease McrA
MDEIYDTGKWLIENIFRLDKRDKLEKEHLCELCHKKGFGKSMIQLTRDNIPAVLIGYYHVRCAEQVFQEYQKVCHWCGDQYTERFVDGQGGLCEKCNTGQLNTEYWRLRKSSMRTIDAGLPTTLTLREWIQTLNDFGWSCAYCGHKPFKEIDHFIPIFSGGGTTRNNCVPTCSYCNHHKKDRSPFVVYPNVANQIVSYLKGRG